MDRSTAFFQKRTARLVEALFFAGLTGVVSPCLDGQIGPTLTAPAIIPAPVSLRLGEGPAFVITAETRIQSDAAAAGVGDWFAKWSGLRLAPSGAIVLAVDPALKGKLGDEGYQLTATGSRLAIHGATAAGVFYGVQTLRQLLPPDMERGGVRAAGGRAEVSALEIADQPRLPWRGAMLDAGRHFATAANVKRFLDEMALHKLNVLHWHLTEDQGWRIEIKKYPRLTQVGAWRASSPVAGGKVDDGIPYGGFYTQDEVREVVAYAKERFIRVMPEIELPGHSSAALASYPEFGNTDTPGYAPAVQVGWGIFPYIYAPKPATFQFLDDVFIEMIALFPGEFIHIGGDEAKKDQWIASPIAQAFIKANGLKDERELQSWFIRRTAKFFEARGRRLVGWDEIQEDGGLPPGATVMAWRNVKWAIAAAREGHDVVMAVTSYTYLHSNQGTAEEEGESVGGRLPLKKVYSFEPVPPELEPQFRRHVLGAQGQLWSEHMESWPKVEFHAWPRLSALAEVLWSPPEKRDYADFQARLPWLFARLDRLGVNYRRSRATDDAPPPAPAR